MKAGTHIITLCVLASALTCGCMRKSDKKDHAMAAQLYRKSLNIVKLYSDSIRNVTDSAHFTRMCEGFDESLAKLNYQFPANTDLQFTEEENDSMIRGISRLVELIREKRKKFGMSPNDSVARLAKDSLAVDAAHRDSTSISQSRQLNRN